MGFDGEPGIDENSKVAVESRFVLQGGSPPGYPPTKK
jgi:hypothetical protein